MSCSVRTGSTGNGGDIGRIKTAIAELEDGLTSSKNYTFAELFPDIEPLYVGASQINTRNTGENYNTTVAIDNNLKTVTLSSTRPYTSITVSLFAFY